MNNEDETRARVQRRYLLKGLVYVLHVAQRERGGFSWHSGLSPETNEALLSLLLAYFDHEDENWRARLQIHAGDPLLVWDLLDRWTDTMKDADPLAVAWMAMNNRPPPPEPRRA